MRTLRRQRFADRHLGNRNVALAGACMKRGKGIDVCRAGRHVGYLFFVDAQWLVEIGIIERQHPLFANDGNVTGLTRVEPRGM